MKIGIALPQRGGTDLRADLPLVCETAEREGFSSVWVYERLLYPTDPDQPMYDVPGLPWNPAYDSTADPLALLAAAAALTGTVRLGSSVLVAALHQPVELAKALATIDGIAGGGRVIAGLAVGWSNDEFAAVGGQRRDRGARLDEAIEVLRAVWGPNPVSLRTDHVTLDADVSPKPLGPIPIMIGGGASDAAMQRIAREADGFLPTMAPGPVAMQTSRQLDELAARAGRGDVHLEVINRVNVTLTSEPLGDDRQPYSGTVEQIAGDLAANADAGVDEVIVDQQLDPGFADTRTALDNVKRLREAAARMGAAG